MLYVQWVRKVLHGMDACENDRTRVVGLPAAALRETLGVDLSDVDAIEDALYDLSVLGLARQRPSGAYNLTTLGRKAVARSIEDVCDTTIYETCTALTSDERSFLHALTELSQREYDGFARMRYVDVDQVFSKIGMTATQVQQESFLLSLIESTCIDYQEFPSARGVRPLFTGVVCTTQAQPAVGAMRDRPVP